MRVQFMLGLYLCGMSWGCQQEEDRVPFRHAQGEPEASCHGDYAPEPVDGDIPAEEDDFDEDGIPNLTEYLGGDSCAGPDADSDGIANLEDLDSDNDGLLDSDEMKEGTDPFLSDTDGDGDSDLVELRAAFTDPLDDESFVDRSRQHVLELPLGAKPETLTLAFTNSVEVIDIFLLVETSVRMFGTRAHLTESDDAMLPEIAGLFEDAYMGLGSMEDYSPGVSSGRDCSLQYPDRPFRLMLPMRPALIDTGTWSRSVMACPVADLETGEMGGLAFQENGKPDMIDGLNALPCHCGDEHDAAPYATALSLIATGKEHSWTGTADGNRMTIEEQVCRPVPGELPRWGYPCFRDHALPVVILIGKAAFHNDSSGGWSVSATHPDIELEEEITYHDALAQLRFQGIRVITLGSTSPDFVEMARQTRALGPTGEPLAGDTGEEDIWLRIKEALQDLKQGPPRTLTGMVTDASRNPDDVDVRDFVRSLTTYTGRNDGTQGPAEGVTYAEQDKTTFFQVQPRTELDYTLTLQNTVVEATQDAQVFRLLVRIVSEEATFGAQEVSIIVPPEGLDSIL